MSATWSCSAFHSGVSEMVAASACVGGSRLSEGACAPCSETAPFSLPPLLPAKRPHATPTHLDAAQDGRHLGGGAAGRSGGGGAVIGGERREGKRRVRAKRVRRASFGGGPCASHRRPTLPPPPPSAGIVPAVACGGKVEGGKRQARRGGPKPAPHASQDKTFPLFCLAARGRVCVPRPAQPRIWPACRQSPTRTHAAWGSPRSPTTHNHHPSLSASPARRARGGGRGAGRGAVVARHRRQTEARRAQGRAHGAGGREEGGGEGREGRAL